MLAITTGLSICSFMAVFFTVLLLAPLLPMAKSMSAAQLEALAALAGVLAIARSPASAVRGGSLITLHCQQREACQQSHLLRCRGLPGCCACTPVHVWWTACCISIRPEARKPGS